MKNILNLIFFVAIVGCRQASHGNVEIHSQLPNDKWQTLDDAAYSIQYPTKWEIVKGGQMPMTFFYSPLESKEDNFRENVNVLIENLPQSDIDLNKYAEVSEEQIKTMLTNSVIIESKRIKNDSQEFQKMIYTGDQGIFHLKFEQYYFVKNSKAFVLTFTSQQNTFDNYKETAENILNSFQLKQ